MDRKEYRFNIDAFRPETLPMKRFAEYVRQLSRLFGNDSEVHFDRIVDGSAEAIMHVDEPAQARVAKRLQEAALGEGDKEALVAYGEIDRYLANDNAVGILKTAYGENIIKFQGRERPEPVEYPAFYEPASLEGILVSLGGRDDTKHAQLDDGTSVVTGIQTRDGELLKRLRGYLFGQPIRLIGRGRFQRTAEGVWDMKVFNIHDFEPLNPASFEDTIAKLRSVKDGLQVNTQLLETLKSERIDGEK